MSNDWETTLGTQDFYDDMEELIHSLSKDLAMHANEFEFEFDVNGEGVYTELTVGMNEKGEWGWQSGDNSFTGGAYGYPHWAVIHVAPDMTNGEVEDAAEDIARQLADLLTQ